MTTTSSARRSGVLAALAAAGTLLMASCSSSSTPAAAGSSAGASTPAGASAPASSPAAPSSPAAAPGSSAPASSAAGPSSSGAGSSGSAAGSAQPSGGSLASLVPADLKSGATFAVFSDWAPEEFVEGGQVKGWSVDLTKAMVASLGMTVKYESTGFDNIIPGLGNGRYNAAVASLGVTPERLQTVDFVPLQKEGTGFAWKKGNSITVNTIKDACGKTVAVLTGAFEYQYLTEQNSSLCGSNPMKIQQFKDQPSAELAVTSGRVDLVAAGSGKLKYTAKQGGQLEVSDLLINAVYNGIGLPKGSKLGPALEAALQAAIDNGTYAKIRADWGATSKGDLTKAVLITESNPEG